MIKTIREDSSILEAMKSLNETKDLTVFVLNSNDKIIGTLTDGDVRRYIIGGGALSDKAIWAANKKFASVLEGDVNILTYLHDCRERGIKLVPCLDKNGCIVRVFDLVNYKSHLPIDAVLMAGGKGERLRPLTEKTPKPLLTVGNKAIIDHNIDRLIAYGVNHINVTVNYLKEQLEEHFAEPRNGVKVNTYREPEFLGTIGSIKFVESFYNDTILVMNSDLFTNIDFEDFYLHFKSHEAEMSVAAVPYNVSVPYGILDLDGSEVKGLMEKPNFNYYANAGIYLMKKSVLKEIPDDEFYNAPDLMEKLIAQNKRVVRYPLNATWIDIGNIQEYNRAKDLAKHLKLL